MHIITPALNILYTKVIPRWINKMWRHQSNRSAAQNSERVIFRFPSFLFALGFLILKTLPRRRHIDITFSLYNVIKYTFYAGYIRETFPNAHHHSIGRYTIFIKRFITSFDLSPYCLKCAAQNLLATLPPPPSIIKYKNILYLSKDQYRLV